MALYVLFIHCTMAPLPTNHKYVVFGYSIGMRGETCTCMYLVLYLKATYSTRADCCTTVRMYHGVPTGTNQLTHAMCQSCVGKFAISLFYWVNLHHAQTIQAPPAFTSCYLLSALAGVQKQTPAFRSRACRTNTHHSTPQHCRNRALLLRNKINIKEGPPNQGRTPEDV